MPVHVLEDAADTRWRRWLTDGERRDRRRAVRTRLMTIAAFCALAGWMAFAVQQIPVQ